MVTFDTKKLMVSLLAGLNALLVAQIHSGGLPRNADRGRAQRGPLHGAQVRLCEKEVAISDLKLRR